MGRFHIARASAVCAGLLAGTLAAAAPDAAVTPVPGTLPPGRERYRQAAPNQTRSPGPGVPHAKEGMHGLDEGSGVLPRPSRIVWKTSSISEQWRWPR